MARGSCRKGDKNPRRQHCALDPGYPDPLLLHQSCVNLGKPSSQSLPLAIQEFAPFESCRYNLLEQNGFILLSLNPSADSDAEDKFHHKKHTSGPDSHMRSAASCAGRLCVTPATPKTPGCSQPASCQPSPEQYSSPLSCGFRRRI